jgi:hypothetical protein
MCHISYVMALFAFLNITADDVHNYHLILMGPVKVYTNRIASNDVLLSNLRWQAYSSRISKVPFSCS